MSSFIPENSLRDIMELDYSKLHTVAAQFKDTYSTGYRHRYNLIYNCVTILVAECDDFTLFGSKLDKLQEEFMLLGPSTEEVQCFLKFMDYVRLELGRSQNLSHQQQKLENNIGSLESKLKKANTKIANTIKHAKSVEHDSTELSKMVSGYKSSIITTVSLIASIVPLVMTNLQFITQSVNPAAVLWVNGVLLLLISTIFYLVKKALAGNIEGTTRVLIMLSVVLLLSGYQLGVMDSVDNIVGSIELHKLTNSLVPQDTNENFIADGTILGYLDKAYIISINGEDDQLFEIPFEDDETVCPVGPVHLYISKDGETTIITILHK